jgi:hypothetical protein
MITVTLTPQQFSYLKAAVLRDEAELEEMAPWDIGDEAALHEQELRIAGEVGRLLAAVEQEQVVKH